VVWRREQGRGQRLVLKRASESGCTGSWKSCVRGGSAEAGGGGRAVAGAAEGLPGGTPGGIGRLSGGPLGFGVGNLNGAADMLTCWQFTPLVARPGGG